MGWIALGWVMATGNQELEVFKTQINFCEYAASQGFELDRKLSSKSSAVMRHPNGDKIIVSKRPNGHWTYFNVHGSDSGTVIDFVKTRKALSLGSIRKELRPWVGKTVSVTGLSPSSNAMELIPVQTDLQQVHRRWTKSRPLNSTDSYLASRGIPHSILEDPLFEDRVRIDDRKNCLFPHWDSGFELSGYEIKGQNFTGFAPGGTKYLWFSQQRLTDNTMIVCESAIDALSLAAIAGTASKRFFSTAGKCGPKQLVRLAEEAKRIPPNSVVWLALDNDTAGRTMAGQIREALQSELGDQVRVIDKFPKEENADWNDMLRKQLAETTGISPTRRLG